MTVTDDKWTQVRVEVGLIREVDKIVHRETIFGARRYFSRNDFVKDAILRLVQQYQEEAQQQQQNPIKKAKNTGEEILVTRK